jgi:hypothetical protein
LPVSGRVDLEVGGFGCEPHLAAGVELEFCYCRRCDVYQGRWLSLEVEPDPVG